MVGRTIGVLISGGVGVLITIFGWLIWKKEMIPLMHDYHTDKVSALLMKVVFEGDAQ